MNVFENQTSTRATVVIVKCYENHANDSRVTEEPDVSQTLNRRMGTGGGNLPIVLMRRESRIRKPKEQHTR